MTAQELYEKWAEAHAEQECSVERWEDLDDLNRAVFTTLAKKVTPPFRYHVVGTIVADVQSTNDPAIARHQSLDTDNYVIDVIDNMILGFTGEDDSLIMEIKP